MHSWQSIAQHDYGFGETTSTTDDTTTTGKTATTERSAVKAAVEAVEDTQTKPELADNLLNVKVE